MDATTNQVHASMIVTLPDKSSQRIRKSTCSVSEILHRFEINPLEVIVSVNGKVVPEDALVTAGDRIRIIPIAHGG